MLRLFVLIVFIGIQSGVCLASGIKSDTVVRNSELSVWTGYWTLSSIDELYSYQKYTGGNIFIGATYKYKTHRNLHLFTANYSKIGRAPDNMRVPEEIDMFESRYRGIKSIMFDLNYSFMRKIYSHTTEIYISGNFINSFNLNDGSKPELFFNSIAPGIAANYSSNKHVFGFKFSLPLVSLTIRNNYHISGVQTNKHLEGTNYIRENAKIETIGDFLILYSEICYAYSISRKFNIEAQYHFRYISDKEPRALKSVSGMYTFGLTYKF